MSEKSLLAEALAKAQAEFTPVNKAKTAKVKMKTGGEYSYKYADFADVLKMALPILSKNGLAFTQLLRKDELKLRVSSMLIHGSGERLMSDGIAIPEMLNPQEFGSCLTYWRRYDGCCLLGIAPDDDEDARQAALSAKNATRKVEHGAKLEQQERSTEAIKPFQVAAFNSGCKQSGKTETQIAEYLRNLKLSSVEEIQKCDFDAAIKWATSGEVVQQKDLSRLFAMAAEKRIPEVDVRTYAHEACKVASMKDLTKKQFAAVESWIKEQTA